MCGEKERISQNQSSFKQQQQQTKLDLSVKQHYKHNQNNRDTGVEKLTHQYLFDQFRKIYPTSRREQFFNPL